MIKLRELNQYPTYRYWWQWWSNWDDVCMFDFAEVGCVLQASRSRTGKIKFRTAQMKSSVFACSRVFVRHEFENRSGVGPAK